MAKDTRHFYQKKRIITLMTILPLIILAGVYISVKSIYYKTTDDAYVEGHIITVAPRVAGPVVKMHIDDNMMVKKGDLLIEIDPKDYQTKLKQSQAKLEEAKASVVNAESQVNKTYSELDYAKDDYSRYTQSYRKGISSTQDYDLAKTKYTTAENENKSAKAKYDELTASIKRLEATVEEDKLNLSYTKIYAPQDGKITNRTVELGNYVQIAQPLFAIAKDDVWIVANYKETQVANMKKGQKVKIKIDAYGRKTFNGVIDSIQMASGAKASLFPPENAVGSYVKIVQRIPVKILFTDDISKYNIIPGMSVVPTVKVK